MISGYVFVGINTDLMRANIRELVANQQSSNTRQFSVNSHSLVIKVFLIVRIILYCRLV